MAGAASGNKPALSLVALSTMAVGAVYAAGYVYTEPTAGSLGSGSASHIAGNTTSPNQSQSHAGGSRHAAAKKTSASHSAHYKDGVFVGSGSNPYGTLSVAVHITNGRITGVNILSYTMHYPSYLIDPYMNREVVKMQTYRVYGVTGATASSINFAEAVYFALKKAKA